MIKKLDVIIWRWQLGMLWPCVSTILERLAPMTSDELNVQDIYKAQWRLDNPDPPTNFDKVREFTERMEMVHDTWPPTQDEANLRWRLMDEELTEVQQEFIRYPKDKIKIAKELADLLYVVYGTAVSFGIPIDEVFDEVHRSNMSKLVDGKPVKREDGKVLKGPNYKPPQLELIFK